MWNRDVCRKNDPVCVIVSSITSAVVHVEAFAPSAFSGHITFHALACKDLPFFQILKL